MKTTVHFKLFNSCVVVLVGEYKDIEKLVPKRIRGIFESDTYRGKAYEIPEGHNYICKCLIHVTSRRLSTVSHESVHAVNFILKAVDIDISRDKDELQAYMVEYIVSEVEKSWGKT